MKITFLSRGNYTDFVLSELSKVKEPDVLVFSSGIIDKLDLMGELVGKSNTFYDLCVLSKSMDCVVICACDTEVYGVLRKSAVLIDCGKLSGVSDMAHVIDESPYSPGGGYKIFDTSRGKIGIIVGEDLYFPEAPQMLSTCESDVIIAIFGRIYNHIPQLMMRAAAFANGISICMAAEGYVQICDIKGEILCATDAKMVEYNLEIIKDFHLLQARRRGFYKEINSISD